MGHFTLAAVAILFVAVSYVFATHGHQGYFQYANVPAYGQYEFGYHRGNPSHYTSRYEQAHNWKFRTKVRWGDKHGGYGEHYYDYNHVDKGHKGHGGGHGHHGWGHGGGSGGGGGGGGIGGGGGQGAFSEAIPIVSSPRISNENPYNQRNHNHRLDTHNHNNQHHAHNSNNM